MEFRLLSRSAFFHDYCQIINILREVLSYSINHTFRWDIAMQPVTNGMNIWNNATQSQLTRELQCDYTTSAKHLVAAWGLLNPLGSNTSRSKRIFKNCTSFTSCYLGGTWTSKVFLFKLGLLTCYLLFVPFLTWFHCWGGANVLKGNIREFKKCQIMGKKSWSSCLKKIQTTRKSKKGHIKNRILKKYIGGF